MIRLTRLHPRWRGACTLETDISGFLFCRLTTVQTHLSNDSARTLLILSPILIGITNAPLSSPAESALPCVSELSFWHRPRRGKQTPSPGHAHTKSSAEKRRSWSSLPRVSAETVHCTTAMEVVYALERKLHKPCQLRPYIQDILP